MRSGPAGSTGWAAARRGARCISSPPARWWRSSWCTVRGRRHRPREQPALDDHRQLEAARNEKPGKPFFEQRRERRRLLRAGLAVAAAGALAGCDALSHDERAVDVLRSAESR